MDITHCIEKYVKVGVDFVEEYPLEGFNLEQMIAIFNVPSEDTQMYDFYEIKAKHNSLFPNIIFDFRNYQYFLACYQKE